MSDNHWLLLLCFAVLCFFGNRAFSKYLEVKSDLAQKEIQAKTDQVFYETLGKLKGDKP